MSPSPTRPVPVLVGGFSAAAKRRAARLGDGWISDLHTSDEIAAHVAEIRELRVSYGRAEEPFSVVAAASDAYTIDGYRRLEEAGVTHVQTLPWAIFGSAGDSLEEKRAGVARFGEQVISKMT
jgi:alkanesulfonate monooxygenase SsuD/methylene tetrahydromethanopterin reductase-like flavin-dependent oxidoreductase (luciferase family)